MLDRAFGPVTAAGEAGAPPDPSAAVDAALRLGVAPRIVSRCGRERLEAELGEAASALRAHHTAVVATELRWEVVAARVARVAEARGLELAFLKGFALRLLGHVPEGSRGSSDLDLLVARDRAEELQKALVADGFREADTSEQEHQLPPLVAPSGGVVEVHRMVLGLRLREGRSAGFEELERAGLLREAPALEGRPPWPGRCRVPVRAALAAHAVVHGIAQHGFAPDAYPALRLPADLLDLGGLSAEDAATVESLLGGEVSREEVEAVGDLCRGLAAGRVAQRWPSPESSPGAALLHHFLAGIFLDDYRRSLRFQVVGRPLSDRSRLAGHWSTLRKALWPTRAEMAAIHGVPVGRVGYLLRLIARPLDLLVRSIRYGLSAGRIRSGRR